MYFISKLLLLLLLFVCIVKTQSALKKVKQFHYSPGETLRVQAG
jgi:hypothetical protein